MNMDMIRHAAPAYDLLFQSINKSRSVGNLDVTIQNCRLERIQSAGLFIEVVVAHDGQFNFCILNSTISNHEHGGIMIHQPSVSTGTVNFNIEGSHIRDNQLSMLKHYDRTHYAAGLSVHSETFNTINVTIKHTEFKGNADSRSRPVVVYIARAFHVLVESCNFTDNNGTAIQLNNVNDKCAPESFNFKGIVNFTGNLGYRGGALSLISAVISIKPNTTLIFENNRATDVGGAIFVDNNIPYNDETDPDTLVSCFYRFPKWDEDSKSYSISFSNNMAINGGNDIYGALLNCYCIVFTGSGVNKKVRSADPSVAALFNISKNDYGSSVSSTPYRVCLTGSDDSIVNACTNVSQIFRHDVTVYPGQEFILEAVLVGFEFGQGTGTINAQLIDNGGAEIWPKRSKFQRIGEPTIANLSYTLYSNDTSDKPILVLMAENRNEINKNLEEGEDRLREAINEFHSSGIISSDLLTTPVYVNVKFKPECPPGFQLRQPPKINTDCATCKETQSIYNGCHCLEVFDGVMDCLFDSDHEDGYLCLKKSVWVSVDLNDNKMLFSDECPLDYCKANLSNIIISSSNDNLLCNSNREGKLCGKCIEDYSLMLGSNKCAICSNNYIGLLAVFAAAGIILVILLIVLNVTVAQGTLNGLIFYANIVWAYNEIFFPKYDDFNFLKMFIAWLNLDFGIEVCFFNGLNAYWKTWLQFLFPIYIWIIAGVIILLGRLPYLDQLLPRNIVQVLATLVLLSYSKLLRTVIIVLVPATVDTYSDGHNNSTDTVWRFDGEIKYGQFPKHCLLLSVAILAVVFLWIPYTFILLFIRYTRNWSVIVKLKPFYESYTGPLTPNCQFWVGLLLLIRCVLLVSLINLHPDASVLSMVVIIILIFVLLYNTGSIYNDTTDNISGYKFSRFVPDFFRQLSFLSMLDISFLLNLVFLGVAVLYADFKEGDKNDIKAKRAVTYASIGIVMIQFVGIIIYPRFQQYILSKFIIDPDLPESEPEIEDDRHREATYSSIEGTPLIKDEDADDNANT
jgi:predicted outer membrane repeat protein